MAAVGSAFNVNPYGGDALAFDNSSYSMWRENKLERVLQSPQKLSQAAECAHGRFRALVTNADYPCLGAKAAVNGNCYRFGFYPEMNSAEATAGLAHDLWEYARERTSIATDYATFAAVFTAPNPGDEREWENLLWTQLQKLHDLDFSHRCAWDSAVSSDPENSGFSFSFAETAFFIVGLNPASSRTARQFPYPALIFNAHSQFESLREQNKFERMRGAIRERDFKLQGSLNPNLSNFGEQSEARQYSGRAVEPDWRCPFQPCRRAADSPK